MTAEPVSPRVATDSQFPNHAVPFRKLGFLQVPAAALPPGRRVPLQPDRSFDPRNVDLASIPEWGPWFVDDRLGLLVDRPRMRWAGRNWGGWVGMD